MSKKVHRRRSAGEGSREKVHRRRSTGEGPSEKVRKRVRGRRFIGEGLSKKVRGRGSIRKKGCRWKRASRKVAGKVALISCEEKNNYLIFIN